MTPESNPLSWLHVARLIKGKKQREVAADLHIHLPTLSAYETGARRPTAAHRDALAKYLGFPAWLLFDTTHKQPIDVLLVYMEDFIIDHPEYMEVA